MIAERSHGARPQRSVASVNTRPSANAPLMFTTNVPHGKRAVRAAADEALEAVAGKRAERARDGDGDDGAHERRL